MQRSGRSRGRLSIPRLLVGGAALLGACALLLRLPELAAAFGSLLGLGPIVVPMGLALVGLGALARALQTRTTSHLVGVRSPWRRDFELSATTYATNKVVKSGGLAGLVHHLADADSRGYHRPSVTAAYLAVKVADTIAFSGLVVVAMSTAWLAGVLHGPQLIAAVVTLGYVAVLLAGLLLVARSPERARRLACAARARFRRRRGPATEDHDESTFDEISRLFASANADRARAHRVLTSAVAGKLVGFATLYLVVDALGLAIGVVPLAAIYVFGLAAAMVGPLPGGLGATEVSLTALLVAAGASSPAAAAAVVAFRLFDFWLPTVIGLGVGALSSRARREATPRLPSPAISVHST